jgi:hypothetical protein
MYEVHEDRGGILKSHLVGRPPARGLCTTREVPQASHWIYPARFEQPPPTPTQPHNTPRGTPTIWKPPIEQRKSRACSESMKCSVWFHDNRSLSQKTTESRFCRVRRLITPKGPLEAADADANSQARTRRSRTILERETPPKFREDSVRITMFCGFYGV